MESVGRLVGGCGHLVEQFLRKKYWGERRQKKTYCEQLGENWVIVVDLVVVVAMVERMRGFVIWCRRREEGGGKG